MKPIWIVDDDQSIRFVLEKALAREDLPTRSFTNPRDVLSALKDAGRADGEEPMPQVLVSDIRMPGGSGLDLIAKIKETAPNLPIIIMTAFSDLDSAVSAFQKGAFEYLPKPFDISKAVELIHRAVHESQREEVALDAAKQGGSQEMLGQAPAMQDVFRAIGKLSQSNVTVLITGESGSGKELVARALHKHSPRANASFIAINTAAIPKDLLESELFGHERGAFTGAQTMRRGRFEQADGGTLFLDEIGDMPFDLQTRLLRVLSDGHFYRVGGHSPVKSNVRVIAATHQNLEQRVEDGSFREDLFHRLNVIRLRLPALRERREDIADLVKHFLQVSAKQLGAEPKRISAAALAKISQFDFPGNVRQLENMCHWLTVMAPAQTIDVKDLPPEVLGEAAIVTANTTNSIASRADSTPATDAFHVKKSEENTALEAASVHSPRTHASAAAQINGHAADWETALELEALALLAKQEGTTWDELTRRFESRLIQAALSTTRGRRIEAAVKLGIGRNTITRKIQELGLE
ncbi:nitrogen regulation protein NR(I) [Variovorax sp. PCZ-1]|uniref:nitrogen regulation protein NR(I) n=1 Tax=Variovorax sp. PCZ-1 TaxID=2835533 RepID=UPI001BD199FC|nr:nitrogen regulation protein NR(I) [Variovorax sp. PCZ-1]MBS7807399.1 nitrogen regulation protein NR(I) [Variovorax sp. PCZ-1]